MHRLQKKAHRRHNQLKDTNYELFIITLSLLSLVNFIWALLATDTDIQRVLFFINLLLSLIFLGDFLYRLFTATSKRHYFIREFGWLDLLSALPFGVVKIARLLRIAITVRLLRQSGMRRMLRDFLFDRAGSAILTVFFLIVLVLEFASVSILRVESISAAANIKTASDALWWTLVTVSTVGYGDRYPVTGTGRLIGVLVIMIGVGLFGVLTGYLSNRFLESSADDSMADLAAPIDPHYASILDELVQLKQAHARTESILLDRIAELESSLAERGHNPG